MPKPRILTGYRPTGKLHLGHWFGNLQNMLAIQHDYDAYYFIADWHALTSHWQDTSRHPAFTEEMVLDWCAAGIDPDVCTIYRQSDVPEVAELALYFDMITPMGWLERVPSYIPRLRLKIGMDRNPRRAYQFIAAIQQGQSFALPSRVVMLLKQVFQTARCGSGTRTQ